MRYSIICFVLILCLYACNRRVDNAEVKSIPTDIKPLKGEFAFLLNYGGQLPEDVGLLRNQVVQRRLANIMKDSMLSFFGTAAYGKPIVVFEKQQILAASFFNDSDRVDPAACIVIDVKNDAIWANYWSGDSLLEFTDRPSLEMPDTE